MKAFCIAVLATGAVASCTMMGGPEHTIEVDGQSYAVATTEDRDPVTNNLIEITYLVDAFDITCTSRVQCETLIREAEVAQAQMVQADTYEGGTAEGAPLSAMDAASVETLAGAGGAVEVSTLDAAEAAPAE
ncbi:MAG: hypothetical protein AAGA28_05845 [Pseudomonadota bacterium]